MAWENVLKQQSDRLTRLFGDAATRWQDAKGKAKTGAYTANQWASDMVMVWDNLLNFWWGPFDSGDPILPTLLISSPPSNTQPVTSTCYLLADTETANVTITALGRVGGTQAIPVSSIAHTVGHGSLLSVTVASTPAQKGLYQGLALEGNEPIAVIVVKVG